MELYPDEAVLEAVEPVLVNGVLGLITLFPFPFEAVEVTEVIGGGGGGAMEVTEPRPRNAGSEATGARG